MSLDKGDIWLLEPGSFGWLWRKPCHLWLWILYFVEIYFCKLHAKFLPWSLSSIWWK